MGLAALLHHRLIAWLSIVAAVIFPWTVPVAAQQAAAPAAQVIADFGQVEASVSPAGELRLVGASVDGNRFLRVTAPGGGVLKGQLFFNLPERLAPQQSAGFSVRVRAVGGTVKARLLALDDQNRVILQRRLDFEPSDSLDVVTLPWTRWRWGDSTGGSPREIRRLGFLMEGPSAELQLDDLRLDPPAAGAGPDSDGRQWLRQVAFAGRDMRIAEADGLLVATDAVDGPDQLTNADLMRILHRMRAARATVRRLFGDAVRPIDGPTPPSLLIFRRQEGFITFFEAAGRDWNVSIVPPTAGGMTVQNLAGTTFDPKQGAGRPVFLHESIHAVFANDVRLLSGHQQHSWLHEGLASYLQLCVHPESINRRQLAANFGRRIDPDGRGFFKPLGRVLGRRVPTQQYAQVATLVAYLVDRKPQWLPTIAMELARGRTAEAALRQCGTTLPELQAAWMKWGAETVGDAGDAGAMLPVPVEFAPAEPAPVQRR